MQCESHNSLVEKIDSIHFLMNEILVSLRGTDKEHGKDGLYSTIARLEAKIDIIAYDVKSQNSDIMQHQKDIEILKDQIQYLEIKVKSLEDKNKTNIEEIKELKNFKEGIKNKVFVSLLKILLWVFTGSGIITLILKYFKVV
jgi:chromosome segregation ATPase